MPDALDGLKGLGRTQKDYLSWLMADNKSTHITWSPYKMNSPIWGSHAKTWSLWRAFYKRGLADYDGKNYVLKESVIRYVKNLVIFAG